MPCWAAQNPTTSVESSPIVPRVIMLEESFLPAAGFGAGPAAPFASGCGGRTGFGRSCAIDFHFSKSEHSVPFRRINGQRGIEVSRRS
ncbi:hypothetical protein Sme01_38120 [Sphaerisporangium melleum]|uniref:Uncharacterized protein n=1 Tax=Sphaerisporangium melleum TaxID=321316 RepID=A0A917R104_9ACTN|nr:hypothetical protein GCM10007964_26370 [Sphaerisporangium melleum]GII71336.1 hypothetical protein Sme01_38120 [Sphaerisporangium melleum]